MRNPYLIFAKNYCGIIVKICITLFVIGLIANMMNSCVSWNKKREEQLKNSKGSFRIGDKVIFNDGREGPKMIIINWKEHTPEKESDTFQYFAICQYFTTSEGFKTIESALCYLKKDDTWTTSTIEK